jgi:hypothetical protein
MRTLESFLELAARLNWADAEPIIDMRVRGGGRPVWTSSMNVAKAGLTKALFIHKVGYTRRAYPSWRLNVMPTQQVAVCIEDGYLYSLRGPDDLIESKGMGWGRLPDPDYLLAAINPSKVLLSYAPFKSLDEALMSRIHPRSLAGYTE